jgi:hypothetical protein
MRKIINRGLGNSFTKFREKTKEVKKIINLELK